MLQRTMTTNESRPARSARCSGVSCFTAGPSRRGGPPHAPAPDQSPPAKRADSAAAAEGQATPPGGHRVTQWPGKHIASRRDRTCRRRALAARGKPGRSAGRPTAAPRRLLGSTRPALACRRLLLLPDALKQPEELRLEQCKRRLRYRAARVYDHVPSRRYLRAILTQDLADAPSNPVANHRAAQRLLHADAEAAVFSPIRAIEDCELLARTPLAAAVHRLVVGTAHQAGRARKLPRQTRRTIRWA